jgi:hypothetical protein
VSIVEAVNHAHTFHGLLRRPVHDFWLGQSYHLQHGGSDVDEVVVLRANLALRLDVFRPTYDYAIGRAAIGCVSLRVIKRRVVRDGPSERRSHFGSRAAEFIQVLQLVFKRFGYLIKRVEGVKPALLAPVVWLPNRPARPGGTAGPGRSRAKRSPDHGAK